MLEGGNENLARTLEKDELGNNSTIGFVKNSELYLYNWNFEMEENIYEIIFSMNGK